VTGWRVAVTGAADGEVELVLDEDVTVVNRTARPLVLEVSVEPLAAPGGYRLVEHGRLVLGAGLARETRITTSAPDAILTEDGLRFLVRLEPYGRWSAEIAATSAMPPMRAGRPDPTLAA
jgi:hypothetical protein